MFEKPTATKTLGLHLDGKEIKGAYVQYHQGNVLVQRLFSIEIDPERSGPHHVKPLYMDRQELEFQALLEKSLVVTGLPSSEVLAREITLELTKEADIDAVIEFQVEPLLPYSIEEGIVDRTTLEKTKENTRIIAHTARTDHLTKHLELWHSIEVEPEVISSIPIALTAFSKCFFSKETPHFHIHLGQEETTCILINKGKLLSAHSIALGVQNLLAAYQKDTSQEEESEEKFSVLNYSTLVQTSFPELIQTISSLRLELTKLFYATGKQLPETEITEVLVTGEGSTLDGLTELLLKKTNKEIALPLENDPVHSSKELQRFAVPIGLALTTTPEDFDQINFRKKDYLYPHPWKRIKKPMGIYLALCAAFAFALLLFGNNYIGSKEDQLKAEYVDLLTFMKKPFSDFEREFYSIKEEGKELPPVDVIKFSQKDLQARLNRLENEIKETPDMFPLFPNVPKVSDVLAWLSNHPHIIGENREETIKNPRILLESFSYKMIKRPEQNKKREKYQVKVEIEFSTPTPRYAREFHDILLAPNDLIDPDGDIKWSAELGRYRASFFLKDKTGYPFSSKR